MLYKKTSVNGKIFSTTEYLDYRSLYPKPSGFFDLLKSFEIDMLIDIRRFLGSRKYPHFSQDQLEVSLPEREIGYLHLENLGGRRKVSKDSKNSAWRLASFRGYADYMETEAFKEAAEILQKQATVRKVAFMCTEAVWWSCHRSLVSDYLKVRGLQVNHIMGEDKTMEHPYTKPARVVNTSHFF